MHIQYPLDDAPTSGRLGVPQVGHGEPDVVRPLQPGRAQRGRGQSSGSDITTGRYKVLL